MLKKFQAKVTYDGQDGLSVVSSNGNMETVSAEQAPISAAVSTGSTSDQSMSRVQAARMMGYEGMLVLSVVLLLLLEMVLA